MAEDIIWFRNNALIQAKLKAILRYHHNISFHSLALASQIHRFNSLSSIKSIKPIVINVRDNIS